MLDVTALRGRALVVDGFNCLITVEAMLSGAPLFRGRDGALRDLASLLGTYRAVDESERAAGMLAGLLRDAAVGPLRVLLDRPVGNSRRTRALFAHARHEAGVSAQVQLSDTVDRDLVASGAVVASSDGWILDHARASTDLPAALLRGPAWLIDLRDDGPPSR